MKRHESFALWAAICSTSACGLVSALRLDALAPASILAGVAVYLLGRAHEARRR
jgi:hypothetical protein